MLENGRGALRLLLLVGMVGCGPSPVTDGGTDAPTDAIGGGADASAVPDADAAQDAPGDAGPSALHDCGPGDFVDETALDAERMVHFHGPRYAPRCVTVAAGQTVTFMGDTSVYPLAPGVAPSRAGDPPGTAPNPIPMTTSGELTPVEFPTAGLYPFHSPGHDARGMFGVVQVR